MVPSQLCILSSRAEDRKQSPRDRESNQLAERYEEVTGEPCRSRHNQYIVRLVAWMLQTNAEGGLIDRARRRARARL